MVTFKNILDRASITLFQDYKLKDYFINDPELFYEFLSGFLENSCDMFNGCLSSLSYHYEQVDIGGGDLVEMGVFDSELSNKEIYILCLGVCCNWMQYHILDVTQFSLHLSNRDFKSFSEANNLKVKQNTYDVLYENFNKEILEYQMTNFKKLKFFGGG